MGRIKELVMAEKCEGLMEPAEIDYKDQSWYESLYAETANDESMGE